jgi:DNA polymerase I
MSKSHFQPKLFLIDSYALAFRMYYAYSKNPLVNSQGVNVSLIHGYWGSILRVLAVHKPSYFAIVRDMSAPTFRHHLYPEYKANRGPMPEDMAAQLPMLQELLDASGIPVLGQVGYEADDVMAAVARMAEQQGCEVFLVTKDKDMAQVVSDRIKLFQIEKGADGLVVGPGGVMDKFGVPPEKMRDYLALVGDTSDNVPGVPKVGPKTAVQLLVDYGDLDGIYAHLDKIERKSLRANLEAGRESAFLSRELVTLQSQRDFGYTLEELQFRGIRREEMRGIFNGHEVRSLLKLLDPVPDKASWGLGLFDGFQEDVAQPKVALPTYTLVDHAEAFHAMEKALGHCTLLALDTETDSLDALTCGLVGLCVSGAENQGYYIPVGHTAGGNLERSLWEPWLRRQFHRHECEWVFHNAKFDLHVLERVVGVPAGKVWDSLLAAWLLNPGFANYGLDEQVRKRLAHEMIPIEALIGRGKAQKSFADVPVAEACPYSAEDAVFTLRLWNVLSAELQDKGLFTILEKLEMPLLPCLLAMERTGIALDRSALETLGRELEKRLADLEGDVFRSAGHPFNISSPKQMGQVLFEELGLPVIKKTATGPSTDASVLEELSRMEPAHPILAPLLEFRELQKLQNTYVEVLPTLVSPRTGRIHTSFLPWGTATGRLSSRDPNLQNIPIRTGEGKRIRAAFVPSVPGHVILSVDYSQIELRMLAHLSGDPALQEAYREGLDIHARTAAALYGVPATEVTSDMRRSAKTVNFGVLYGMTAFRLARDLQISRSDAKLFIDGYFGLYNKVGDFVDKTVAFAREHGYVETISGRRRYIPGIDSNDHTERQMAERMAVNTPVQGSAADLIKEAMTRIHQRIQQEKLPLQLLLQVHDELVFECPAERAAEFSAWVKAEMEGAMTLSVPLVAEAGIGPNWLAAH